MAHVASTNTGSSQTNQFARGASPWMERLARFGYVAKGVVFLLIGIVALDVARGLRSQATGAKGAIGKLATFPLGHPMVIALAVGLAGYALFQFILAMVDPENHGTDLKGVAVRAGAFFSGIGYGFLAYAAVNVALGKTITGDAQSAKHSTAALLTHPNGNLVVIAGGVLTLLLGLGQLVIRCCRGSISRSRHRAWPTRRAPGFC